MRDTYESLCKKFQVANAAGWEADFAQQKNAEVDQLYKNAFGLYRELKASMQEQIFVKKGKGKKKPVQQTDDNKEIISLYVEVIGKMIGMQLNFKSRKKALPFVERILRLKHYLSDCHGEAFYNVANYYSIQYKEWKNIRALLSSSQYFIRAVISYRTIKLKESELTANILIENFQKIAQNEGKDCLVYNQLNDQKKLIIRDIIARILTQDQLEALLNLRSEALDFLAGHSWRQQEFGRLDRIPHQQVKEIQVLFNDRLISKNNIRLFPEANNNSNLGLENAPVISSAPPIVSVEGPKDIQNPQSSQTEGNNSSRHKRERSVDLEEPTTLNSLILDFAKLKYSREIDGCSFFSGNHNANNNEAAKQERRLKKISSNLEMVRKEVSTILYNLDALIVLDQEAEGGISSNSFLFKK